MPCMEFIAFTLLPEVRIQKPEIGRLPLRFELSSAAWLTPQVRPAKDLGALLLTTGYWVLNSACIPGMIKCIAFGPWVMIMANTGAAPWIGMPAQMDPDDEKQYLSWHYADAIAASGGLPIMLPLLASPENARDLVERLEARATESESEKALRLLDAAREMADLPHYDYVVVNYRERLDETVDKVAAIIVAEHCRVTPRVVDI